MDQKQEWELVVKVKAGDMTAYQTLLNHHLPSLSHYVARMTVNSADAEEIIQDVFLRFWQKAEQYNPQRAKLSTWLHQIAYNICVDFFRKNDKHNIQKHEIITASKDSPQQTFESKQASEILKEAITALPENQRCALVLSHYQGLSNRETAEVLEISVDALESLLRRARKKLQSSLNSRGLERNENNNE